MWITFITFKKFLISIFLKVFLKLWISINFVSCFFGIIDKAMWFFFFFGLLIWWITLTVFQILKLMGGGKIKVGAWPHYWALGMKVPGPYSALLVWLGVEPQCFSGLCLQLSSYYLKVFLGLQWIVFWLKEQVYFEVFFIFLLYLLLLLDCQLLQLDIFEAKRKPEELIIMFFL